MSTLLRGLFGGPHKIQVNYELGENGSISLSILNKNATFSKYYEKASLSSKFVKEFKISITYVYLMLQK